MTRDEKEARMVAHSIPPADFASPEAMRLFADALTRVREEGYVQGKLDGYQEAIEHLGLTSHKTSGPVTKKEG